MSTKYSSTLFVFLLCLTTIGLSPNVNAEDEAVGLEFVRAQEVLDRTERTILEGKPKDEELSQAIKEVTHLRTESKQCVRFIEREITRIKQTLTALGETVDGEASEITQSRKDLQNEQQQSENRLRECQLLSARSDTLLDKLTALQQSQLKDRLIERGLDVRQLALDTLYNPGQWWEFSKNLLAEGIGTKYLSNQQIVVSILLSLVGLGLGIAFSRKLRSHAVARPSDTFSTQLIQASLISLARFLPALILLGSLSAYMAWTFYDVRPIPFIALFLYSLSGYALARSGISIMLHPPAPAKQVTPLPDPLAYAMARRLTVLALLILVGFLLFTTLISQSLPSNGLQFARAIYVAFLVVNMGWFIWLIGKIPALMKSGRGIRFALLTLLFGILVAEWLGYRNLSFYLLSGLFGTLGVIVLFWVISTLFSELFTGLDRGQRSWQRRIRRQLGLQQEEHIPGLTFIRFLTGLLLWAALIILLLRIWGLSDAGLAIIVEYLVDGFQLGKFKIVPSKVLVGLFLFALLLIATGWIKGAMEKRWVTRTRLDAGAREALVTITGYVGFIIAILFGLSMAGFDFQNIAIIFGALGVGIGFGLQNIVSNFVSGIILLFERPIRTGDWVDVGTTQGWVKKIRVRSTEIQTVDRTDVVVPNSEFISKQVTNWTLRDPYGRIKIPVGVAYGSDTQLVKKLLLDVAQAHPQVINGSASAPPPNVLFRSFGDSALLFELRCFIEHIPDLWTVISDINFEIDRVFRENGVQIPFPQRDLHLRSGFTKEPSDKTPEREIIERPKLNSSTLGSPKK